MALAGREDVAACGGFYERGRGKELAYSVDPLFHLVLLLHKKGTAIANGIRSLSLSSTIDYWEQRKSSRKD